MNASFSAEIEDLGDGVMAVVVAGELDQATVPALRKTFEALSTDGAGVLLDLTACEFVDSSGLAAFVSLRDRVTSEPGVGFAVCCPHEQVRRLLELTGLRDALGVAASRDDALAELRAGQGSSQG